MASVMYELKMYLYGLLAWTVEIGYLSKDNKEGSMIIEATLIFCTYCYICTRPTLDLPVNSFLSILLMILFYLLPQHNGAISVSSERPH